MKPVELAELAVVSELVDLAGQVELEELAELVERMETTGRDTRMLLQALFGSFTHLCLRLFLQQLKHTVALRRGA